MSKEERHPFWGMVEMIRLIIYRTTPRFKNYPFSKRIWILFIITLAMILISMIIAQVINHGHTYNANAYFLH
jgi:hypothetical protein